MGIIQTLPEDVITKIAAGEVIQRPANVVKELVENSLDANSTDIRVNIEDSGMTRIEVIDNGDGMSREDLEISFLPHTTSKLNKVSDLDNILSLGFRGEALSSIASVSNLLIESKTRENKAGSYVHVIGGEPNKVSGLGMPTGTRVVVENIFYNVPARKNFLKSPRTEYKKILDIIVSVSLGFPQVRFSLYHNNKLVIHIPRSKNHKARISDIYGSIFEQEYIPLKIDKSHIKISGFISRPQNSGRSKSRQFTYINNRNIRGSFVGGVVKDAYGNLLEARNVPYYFIFFDFRSDMLDVNVHPRKEEVNFVNSKVVWDHLTEAVLRALETHNLTYSSHGYFGANKLLLKDKDFNLDYQVDEKGKDSVGTVPRDFFVLDKKYIILRDKSGMKVYDQHAAHERVIYEQLLKSYNAHLTESLTLGHASDSNELSESKQDFEIEESSVFDLPAHEASFLLENLEDFNKAGIELSEFGKRTFKVIKMPKILEGRNVREIVLGLIEDLQEGIDFSDAEIDKRAKTILSYLACRSAVKTGDKLSKKQISNLISSLKSTNKSYTCPHGRPTEISIDLEELDRMFKRS